jgi:hypothetical protein
MEVSEKKINEFFYPMRSGKFFCKKPFMSGMKFCRNGYFLTNSIFAQVRPEKPK